MIETLTVSELTDRVKNLIEDTIAAVNVTGEISNYKHHSSGHRYFTLKDEDAQLRCVFFRWKAESLDFEPGNGMSVIASGRLTVYKPQGVYQLDVNRMFPAGVGALEMAFRELKEKLFKEGLFDEIHKKPLPEFPLRIGVITSPTGAAIQDFIRTVHNRSPWIDIIIRPTQVQGDGAAEDIAKAIAEFNEYGKVDVIVITRGGGSLEDLWAFNEEIVARGVFESEIPIASAVGHEIDFSICDFVADVRAATPTAAAELISTDRALLLEHISKMKDRLNSLLVSQLKSKKARLNAIIDHKAFQKPISMLEQFSIRLDHLSEKLTGNIRDRLNFNRVRIENLSKRLESTAPVNVLKRGYSVCTDESGHVIRDSSSLSIGEKVKMRFAVGGAGAEVTEIIEEEGGHGS